MCLPDSQTELKPYSSPRLNKLTADAIKSPVAAAMGNPMRGFSAGWRYGVRWQGHDRMSKRHAVVGLQFAGIHRRPSVWCLRPPESWPYNMPVLAAA